MKRPGVVVAVAILAAAPLAVISNASGSSPVPRNTTLLRGIASGDLKPAELTVNGVTKRLPFFSGGIMAAAQELATRGSVSTAASAAAADGISVDSYGCRNRNPDGAVRANQDCTFRRQAETDIAANPTDPKNLVAGFNDSIIGWNQTSAVYSLDGGQHWGTVSTAPFRYRLNAPSELRPTRSDRNRHTIAGGPGTLHAYDACSDPVFAFDSEGRAFYSCTAFDIASNASMVFVVPSPKGAKGSYYDQVYPPFGLIGGRSGREHIVVEDNSLKASHDGPKVAADSYRDSPNRDNVYSTFTVFDVSCKSGYCQSTIYGSMSTDHGFTWSTPEEISGVNRQLCNFGNAFKKSLNPHACNFNGHSDVVVLPNGDLGVSFLNGNTPGANQQNLFTHCRPSGSSPAGTARLNCDRTPTKISDSVFENAPQCDFGGYCVPGSYVRSPVETSQHLAVNEQNGYLFDTWFDYRFGEYDIFLSRSTDGGRTWSPARKVNPDRGMDHYLPSPDVGEGSNASHVGISYYRTERVPNENRTPKGGFALGQPGVGKKMSDFALAGGWDTVTPYAFDVISPRFPAPDGVQAGFIGDYNGLVVIGRDQAHAIWADTRNRAPNPGFDLVTVDEDAYTVAGNLPRS